MTYSAEVLADSPLGYWRLDATAAISAATSSSNFGSEPPSNAVDGSSTTYWTTNGTSSGWLRLQLAAAGVETQYKIRRRDDIPNRNPKDWTFEGSNDGSTWTTLDTRSGITWPTSGETKSYSFTNTTAYLYYRLNVTANNGDTYLSVAELTLPSAQALDSSGNGRDALLVGAPTVGVTGLLVGDTNPAIRFASGKYALGAATTGWNSSTLTVSARVKLNTTGVYQDIVLRNDGGSNGVFLFRITNGNKLQLEFWDSGGGIHDATGATSLVSGSTYSLAATFDGTTAKVYVDGVLDGSLSFSGSIKQPANGQAVQIGGASDVTIDEPAIFGTALSSTRITAHHTAAVTASGSSGSGALSISGSGGAQAAAAGTGVLAISGAMAAGTGAAGTGALSLSGSGTVAGASAAAGTGSLSLSGAGTTAGSAAGSGSLSFGAVGAALAVFVTDVSNAMNGRRRKGRATAWVDRPAAALPPGRTFAKRYDKAIAYPFPDMVDGRPE